MGFPKLSCFLDSDDAFMVYRRFGCVFSRLLLCKQDEIGRIEATLEAMDRTDAAEGNGQFLMSHKLDDDRDHLPIGWPESRKQLMKKLEKKAVEYGENLRPYPILIFARLTTAFLYSRVGPQNSTAQSIRSAISP